MAKKWTTKKICENCGKEYETHHTKQKYCSNECRAEARVGTKTNHKREEKICKLCGKTFMGTYQSKYCSDDCRSKSRSVEPDKIAKRNADHYKREREKRLWLNKYKQDKGCERCGFNDHRALVFHHLIPEEKSFSLGRELKGKEKTLKEIDKCIILCRNCHSIEHYNGADYLTKEFE